MRIISSSILARLFHKYYEELAPTFGYKTRKASAVPWGELPEKNKRLMIAVCDKVIKKLREEEVLE